MFTGVECCVVAFQMFYIRPDTRGVHFSEDSSECSLVGAQRRTRCVTVAS